MRPAKAVRILASTLTSRQSFDQNTISALARYNRANENDEAAKVRSSSSYEIPRHSRCHPYLGAISKLVIIGCDPKQNGARFVIPNPIRNGAYFLCSRVPVIGIVA
jgi:hypothetical protein